MATAVKKETVKKVDPTSDVARAAQDKEAMKKLGMDTSKGLMTSGSLDRVVAQAKEKQATMAGNQVFNTQDSTGKWVGVGTDPTDVGYVKDLARGMETYKNFNDFLPGGVFSGQAPIGLTAQEQDVMSKAGIKLENKNGVVTKAASAPGSVATTNNFNPNTDYTALIAKTSDPVLKAQYEKEKAAKVAAMAAGGYDYTTAQGVQAWNKGQSAPVVGGVTQSQITTAPQATASPPITGNIGQIKAMYGNLTDAQIAALQSSGAKAVSGYEQQLAEAPQTFQTQRSQVDVETARTQQAANEAAAAKGTTFSGGVQSDVGGISGAGSQQKTALTQQEINLVSGLKRAIADVNADTASKIAQTKAETGAQSIQAQIAEQNRLQALQYQMQQEAESRRLQEAGLTGVLDGQKTLAGQQLDIQKEQATKDEAWKQKMFDYQKTQDAQDQKWKQVTFDYQKNRDKVQDGQWLKNFQQQKADQAASRAISWGNLSLNRAQFNWSKDPSNPDNVLKAAAAEAKPYQDSFKTALDMMGATKKGVDDTGSTVDVPLYDKKAVAAYIYNQKLTDAEKERMLKSLGF